jgi:lipoprotein-releasing system permease protein
MKIPYELALGWRYTRAGRATRRNGFISFISGVSMLGIALGVAALIVVLSVMNGFQKEVRDRMLGVVPHIEIVAPQGAALQDIVQTLSEARSNPAVTGAAPFVAAQALVARGDEMKGAMVRGIDPALEGGVTALAASHADLLTALVSGQFRVVLGSELARSLGVQAGDTVTLVMPAGDGASASRTGPRYQSLAVAGLVESGHFQYDAALVWMHTDDALTVFGLRGPTGIAVQLQDPQTSRAVTQQLAHTLHGDLLLRDWSQQNRSWFEAVRLQKRMMFIILALIVAVAAFNLVSTLVMTVNDKRADIAILRTLGAGPRSIMGVFVVQGAMVGLIGTLAGLALGLGIALHIDVIVPAIEHALGARFLSKDIYLIGNMPSDPQSADIVPIALISLALALVATLYPSWRASRVNPAEALRYE